jgi:hypothetical protein
MTSPEELIKNKINIDNPPANLGLVATDIALNLYKSSKIFKSNKFYFQHIVKRISGPYDNLTILDGLMYLSKGNIGLINLVYEFLDDFEGPIPVDSKTVNEAIKNNSFIHPIEGTEVKNFKSQIFLVYELSNELTRN